ncbi:MAG TPA: DUF192 domain-containing protein [bacterium]|nr:DUF192 domain-containing protein [bacterium]
MKKITLALALVAGLFAASGVACHPKEKSGLPVVTLTIDGHPVEAEVANQESTRMTGLMFRREMDKDHGMIFVFADSQIRAFWMKNTFIPLSIAYMDDKGVILNILEMPPQTEDAFYSAGQAKYALEMNTGWYKKNGVKAGDRVEGLAAAPAAAQ